MAVSRMSDASKGAGWKNAKVHAAPIPPGLVTDRALSGKAPIRERSNMRQAIPGQGH
jgi:hypothetical protein